MEELMKKRKSEKFARRVEEYSASVLAEEDASRTFIYTQEDIDQAFVPTLEEQFAELPLFSSAVPNLVSARASFKEEVLTLANSLSSKRLVRWSDSSGSSEHAHSGGLHRTGTAPPGNKKFCRRRASFADSHTTPTSVSF